jgi:hypothetical protein
MGDTDLKYQPVLNRPDLKRFSWAPHKLCGLNIQGFKSIRSLILFLSPVQSLLIQILPFIIHVSDPVFAEALR